MTEWLKNQKALVQPSDADLPYSDPVTAAPAAAPTDTERLDWIASQGCLEIALCKIGQRREYFDVSQCQRSLATGWTLREAIDAARTALAAGD